MCTMEGSTITIVGTAIEQQDLSQLLLLYV